jgi:hypothetical protein
MTYKCFRFLVISLIRVDLPVAVAPARAKILTFSSLLTAKNMKPNVSRVVSSGGTPLNKVLDVIN